MTNMILEMIVLLTINKKNIFIIIKTILVVFSEDQVINQCKHTRHSYTCILSGLIECKYPYKAIQSMLLHNY